MAFYLAVGRPAGSLMVSERFPGLSPGVGFSAGLVIAADRGMIRS
jgi:hypothetical protein